MEFTCAPARDTVRSPRRRAPPGAADCHFHVFGPCARYPLDADQPYTPPPASCDA